MEENITDFILEDTTDIMVENILEDIMGKDIIEDTTDFILEDIIENIMEKDTSENII